MMKSSILFLCFLFIFSVKAQQLETLLLAKDDAGKLMGNYVAPAVKGVMYSMNGGWYTTAKTHKKFGFDITINANASFVPQKEEMFDFVASDYAFLSLPNGETSIPTVMSDNTYETVVDVNVPVGDGTFKVASFEMPSGITDELPINAVATPMVQVGFGLPFKTDIKLRYVPKLSFDTTVDANLVGVGLQHNLMQYFGPLEKLPLSVSVLAAYTNIKVVYNIEDKSTIDNVVVTNGEAEFKMNTWTVQALASLDFKVVTFYAGFGYNKGSATSKLKGDYELTYDIEDSGGNVIGTVNETISNPLSLEFEANGVRATVGSRLNIGFFKIFADYTIQEYNTASAGIAFSFR